MTAHPRVTTDRRRALVTRRHHLGRPSTADIAAVVDDLVALHATDPASVYLSLVARRPHTTAAEIAESVYDRRDLVRMMGMRRTMFVVTRDTAPVVQCAAADAVAARLRRALTAELSDVVDGADRWLAALEQAVVDRLVTDGDATAVDLARAEPRLATRIGDPDGRYGAVAITNRVLTLLAAQGRIVRGRPGGGWTASRYRWSPMSRWFPEGLPRLDPPRARAELVRRYLERFGPVTEADVAWWSGWSLSETRKALQAAGPTEVVLDGDQVGWMATHPDAADGPGSDEQAEGSGVALLPALDPTPMGWKDRDWYLDADLRAALFDRSGNIGPSVWCGGRIVGGWGQRPDGAVTYRLLRPVGAEAARLIGHEADRLTGWLAGTRVTPKFRTPLERELAQP